MTAALKDGTSALRELAGNVELLPIRDLPNYMAGSDGRVWTFTNWRGQGPRPLAGANDSHGYLRVSIKNGERRFNRMVHRVICTAFHGEQANRQLQVRHLNGQKTDNRPSNLAWGTAKENAEDRDLHGTTAWGERNGWSKLTEADIQAARHFAAKGLPTAYMAAYLGVTSNALRDALNGETWARAALNQEQPE